MQELFKDIFLKELSQFKEDEIYGKAGSKLLTIKEAKQSIIKQDYYAKLIIEGFVNEQIQKIKSGKVLEFSKTKSYILLNDGDGESVTIIPNTKEHNEFIDNKHISESFLLAFMKQNNVQDTEENRKEAAKQLQGDLDYRCHMLCESKEAIWIPSKTDLVDFMKKYDATIEREVEFVG